MRRLEQTKLIGANCKIASPGRITGRDDTSIGIDAGGAAISAVVAAAQSRPHLCVSEASRDTIAVDGS